MCLCVQRQICIFFIVAVNFWNTHIFLYLYKGHRRRTHKRVDILWDSCQMCLCVCLVGWLVQSDKKLRRRLWNASTTTTTTTIIIIIIHKCIFILSLHMLRASLLGCCARARTLCTTQPIVTVAFIMFYLLAIRRRRRERRVYLDKRTCADQINYIYSWLLLLLRLWDIKVLNLCSNKLYEMLIQKKKLKCIQSWFFFNLYKYARKRSCIVMHKYLTIYFRCIYVEFFILGDTFIYLFIFYLHFFKILLIDKIIIPNALIYKIIFHLSADLGSISNTYVIYILHTFFRYKYIWINF